MRHKLNRQIQDAGASLVSRSRRITGTGERRSGSDAWQAARCDYCRSPGEHFSEDNMTESYSRQRQRAEIAFGKMQSPPTARERAFDELDAMKITREEKTLRLREARLAKERQDRSERGSTAPEKQTPKR